MTSIPSVRESTFEVHTSQSAAQEWQRLAGNESAMNEAISALPSRLRLPKGVQLNEGDTVGFTSTATLSGPLEPPAEVTARDAVDKVKNTFMARTFTGQHGEQVAACATIIEVPGTDYKHVDVFVLEATDDLLQANELAVTSTGSLEERDGWWDRVVRCLGRDCGGVCLGAALRCPKVNWAAFLVCLAGTCGVCVIKCGACATCDCSWWCKWAAGCCED
ncbi:hypothetical protein AB9Q10_16180 [Streptomyces krungchingensis]|uniref:hypothetical protein n=1 Tax=Streptomyces krungchingensis TaxID=1565034 RepID=UPI003CE80828